MNAERKIKWKRCALLGAVSGMLCAATASQGALLLRYNFDEVPGGAAEATDSGLAPAANGVFIGAAARTNNTPGGFSTGALDLASGDNGSSHYVTAGSPAKLDNLSAFTLTAWLNLRGAPAVNDRIVDKLSSTGGFGWKFVNPTSGTLGPANFRTGLHINSITGQADATANLSADGQWIFLALTYDGSQTSANLKYYRGTVGGAVAQLGSTVSFNRGVVTNTPNELRVGGTPATTADRTPPAWLDDVRVYDAVLSLAELENVRRENVPLPPVFITQPKNQTVDEGAEARFTALADGAAPMAYQWYFGNTPLLQATNADLTLTNVTAGQEGDYRVVASNVFGMATSGVARLTVLPPQPLALLGAVANGTRLMVTLTFNRPLEDAATNTAHYALDGGLSVVSAALDSTLSNVVLTTSLQAAGAAYIVGVSGVRDRSTGETIAPGATATFYAAAFYGPARNAPESAAWTLLASLSLADTANFSASPPVYDIDHRLWATNYSRVAYYLELQAPQGPLHWVWAAMDAFTTDARRLVVPTVDSGAVFQQPVTNLDVLSSVPGLAGAGLSGMIRFYPGSDITPGVAGPGAMELSHHPSGQRIFAFNDWGVGGEPTLGIGTNAAGARTWAIKRLLVYVLPPANPPPVEADIVVYGGTSGGVAAAVQAARLGKRAVLVATDNHLGGLSSGGLGWTDIGQNGNAYIGGLAREFYERNGARYGQSVRFNLEPRIAEQIFGEMLAEAGVPVFFNQRLVSAQMNGRRLTAITMDNGAVYQGKMFIDTTYEGDLIAQAGVSFTVGREGTNTYGESYAGTLTPGNGGYNYDAYVVPGDPGSGLLPLVWDRVPAPRGSADEGVQAYNYRMAFTQRATNFLPVVAPDGYDPAQFEVLARYIEARVAKDGSTTLGHYMTLDRPPATGKYDINNNGHVSTDMIGFSWTWATNTHAARAAIARAHEDYMRGFFTFLAASPRAPANVRDAMNTWGLCKDEFLDTGGWPHALYVREARRMVSDYVMTQQNCQGSRVAGDGIGLGSYPMDSHGIHRFASSNGLVMIEGGMFFSTPAPFPISYRSIIPRAGECENVFCTFALSASHVAFGSCRMEPVFMITSQSAATAAAFAMDDGVAAQQLDYARLALQLLADRQVIPGAAAGDSGVIVDNLDATGVTIAGEWTASSATAGFWGGDYLHDGNTNQGQKSVTFTPTLPTDDVYGVYVRWAANSNRATNAPVDVVHPGGTNTFLVNQQVNGGAWVLLMTTNFTAGTNARVVVRNDNASGHVIADAVRFVPLNAPPSTVQVVATDAAAAESGGKAAKFTFVRSGDTNTTLTLNYTLSGTASAGEDYTVSPQPLALPAGAIAVSLVVTPLPDALPEGTETIILTLLPGAQYEAGSLSQATARIADLSAATPPLLAPPVFTGNGWSVGVSGTAGQVCELQRALQVMGPWTNIAAGTIPAPGAGALVDTNPPPHRAYYRVVSP